MKEIVLASSNEGKIKEFGEILKEFKILSLKDIGFTDEIEENGKTFEENALIKAREVSKFLKENNLSYPVIADDSGLCVPELNGEPGIYSARYSGVHGNSSLNRRLLMEKIKDKEKSAYFTCFIVWYNSDDDYKVFHGETYGQIVLEEKGNNGFGYDCIFLSDDLGKTFGEATDEEKNKVSHRYRAIKELQKEIKY